MQITKESGLVRADFDSVKSQLLELTTRSGVEYTDTGYADEFKLIRQPSYHGPFLFVTDTIHVALERNNFSDCETLLLALMHKGQTIDGPQLLTGSRLGMTCIAGTLKYAWSETVIPVTKISIPEALPEVQFDPGIMEDFRLWRHEIKQRQMLTRPVLDLAMREVELIAAQDISYS